MSRERVTTISTSAKTLGTTQGGFSPISGRTDGPGSEVPIWGDSSKFPWETNYSERYPAHDLLNASPFDRKYPPDRFGEEATDNARIWRVLQDSAKDQDDDIITAWNKTLDVLLVATTLFAGVLTAFVIQLYSKMEPDFTEYSARTQLRMLRGLPYDGSLNAELFVVPRNIRQASILWHTSLAIALLDVVFALFAKYSVEGYHSHTRSQASSLRHWAQRYIVLNRALHAWRLGAFVATLPILLLISLAFFLGGLCAYLSIIDRISSIIIATSLLVMIVFSLIVAVVPLRWPDSPFYSPLVPVLYQTSCWIARQFQRANPFGQHPGELGGYDSVKPQWATYRDGKLLGNETARLRLDAEAIAWVVHNVASPCAVVVALDAIGSLSVKEHIGAIDGPGDCAPLQSLQQDHTIQTAVNHRLKELLRENVATGQEGAEVIARFLRTLLFLGKRFDGAEIKFNTAFNPTLERWSKLKTHDIYIMTRCILLASQDLSFHEPPIRDERFSPLHYLSEVARWSLDVQTERPYLMSTVELLAMYSWHRLAQNPNNHDVVDAPTLIAVETRLLLSSNSCNGSAEESRSLSAIAALMRMDNASSATTLMHALKEVAKAPVIPGLHSEVLHIARMRLLIFFKEQDRALPITDLEQCLRFAMPYDQTDTESNAEWPEEALGSALHHVWLLVESTSGCSWSCKIGRIFRGLLLRASSAPEVSRSQPTTAQKGTLGPSSMPLHADQAELIIQYIAASFTDQTTSAPSFSEYSTAYDAFSESILNLLDCGSPSADDSTVGSDDAPSAWRLAIQLRVSGQAMMQLAERLAGLLVAVDLQVPEQRASVYAKELLRGESTTILVATDPERFARIAQRLQPLLPSEFWEQIRKEVQPGVLLFPEVPGERYSITSDVEPHVPTTHVQFPRRSVSSASSSSTRYALPTIPHQNLPAPSHQRQSRTRPDHQAVTVMDRTATLGRIGSNRPFMREGRQATVLSSRTSASALTASAENESLKDSDGSDTAGSTIS